MSFLRRNVFWGLSLLAILCLSACSGRHLQIGSLNMSWLGGSETPAPTIDNGVGTGAQGATRVPLNLESSMAVVTLSGSCPEATRFEVRRASDGGYVDADSVALTGSDLDCGDGNFQFKFDASLIGAVVTIPQGAAGNQVRDFSLRSTTVLSPQASKVSELELEAYHAAPVVTIDGLLPVNLARASNYALGGTCEEGRGDVSLGGDLSGTAACVQGSWSLNLDASALPQGNFSVSARQIDDFGAYNEISAAGLVDTLAPSATLSAPGLVVNYLNESSFPVSGSCSEEGQSYLLQVDGLQWSGTCVAGAFSQSLDLSSLSDGPYQLHLTQADVAGNSVTMSLNIQKDTSVPSLSMSFAPAVTNQTSAHLNLSAVNAGGGLYFTAAADCASGGTWETFSASRTLTLSATEGTQHFYAKVRNSTGTESACVNADVLLDMTAPLLNWTSTPATLTNQTTPSFSFSASDGGSGIASVQCSVDGGTAVNCSSPWSPGALADGAHSVSVQVWDQAGNSLSQTYNWTIDTLAPTLGIGLSHGIYHDGTQAMTLYFYFSEAVSDFDISKIQITGGGSLGAFNTLSGDSYTVNLDPSGITSTITVGIAAGSVHDLAGNAPGLSSLALPYSPIPGLTVSSLPSGSSTVAKFSLLPNLTNGADKYLIASGNAGIDCGSIAYTTISSGIPTVVDFSNLSGFPLGSSPKICLKAMKSSTGQTSSPLSYSYTLADPCQIWSTQYGWPDYGSGAVATYGASWDAAVLQRYVCLRAYGGAGGGSLYAGSAGGNGGFVQQVLLMDSSEAVSFTIGRGGLAANGGSGGSGQGGEMTKAWFSAGPRNGSLVLIAAGGGGGFGSGYDYTSNNRVGGAGGLTTETLAANCIAAGGRGADAWYVSVPGQSKTTPLGDTSYQGGMGYIITGPLISDGYAGGGGAGCYGGLAGNYSGATPTASYGGSNFVINSSLAISTYFGNGISLDSSCLATAALGREGNPGGDGCLVLRY